MCVALVYFVFDSHELHCGIAGPSKACQLTMGFQVRSTPAAKCVLHDMGI